MQNERDPKDADAEPGKYPPQKVRRSEDKKSERSKTDLPEELKTPKPLPE